MTNVYLLLMVGSITGWTVVSLLPTLPKGRGAFIVALGGFSGFIGGLVANGGTLYAGITPEAAGAALGVALLSVGVTLFLTRNRSR